MTFLFLFSDLTEDYHITAYRWIMSYFLQKNDFVHLNSKKLTIELNNYLSDKHRYREAKKDQATERVIPTPKVFRGIHRPL